MAQGTDEGNDPAGTPSLRVKAGRFLGSIPAGYASRDPGNPERGDGSNGANARPIDAGTIDPAQIASDAPKRRGRGKWTAEQHAADRARRGKPADEQGEGAQEKVAVGALPPDPTLVGFATEGLGFLNILIAARFDAPEFQSISREGNETVAKAWLKFFGYYVSIAKATGPMGALAAACMTTAFVYGPPTVMAMRRPRAAPASPSGEGAETMFAPVMPPA